ncbi:MAG TPA: hypothetical protein VK663_10195, partial [Burkholderiales bacterium]|nr:hypothetical protein [Burkholderiales bacterium]
RIFDIVWHNVRRISLIWRKRSEDLRRCSRQRPRALMLPLQPLGHEPDAVYEVIFNDSERRSGI